MTVLKPSRLQKSEATRHPGILKLHARGCEGGRSCKCKPSYRADAGRDRDGNKIRKTFPKVGEANTWREDQRKAVREGSKVAPTKTTVEQAGEKLLAGMRDGTLMNRSGRPFKPSTTRRYELALRVHVKPHLGHRRLSDVERADVKAMVKAWLKASMVPSSIRNNIDPLRVIFREAIEDGFVTLDPIQGMKLPQGGGRRDRVADRAEAEKLIAALADDERALWACAFYGGLRRGELRALLWGDVDLDADVIRVQRGWDDEEGSQATKTDAGARTIPLTSKLRRLLVAHKLASGRGPDDLVFGREATLPFVSSTVRARALKAWKAAKLTPITLHEARHSAASYLIEAGLNDLELTAMIGHTDPRTTKMIYGHLFPDSSSKVAAKLDRYHEQDAAVGS